MKTINNYRSFWFRCDFERRIHFHTPFPQLIHHFLWGQCCKVHLDRHGPCLVNPNHHFGIVLHVDWRPTLPFFSIDVIKNNSIFNIINQSRMCHKFMNLVISRNCQLAIFRVVKTGMNRKVRRLANGLSQFQECKIIKKL